MTHYRFFAWAVTILLLVAACTSYQRQVVPFKMPAAYPNATKVAGATIAARAFDDRKEAREAFGWDIRDAGLYPVQVIFDNLSDHSIQIEPSQTLLIDSEQNIWPILDSSLAYDRITKKSEMSRIAKGGAKTGLLTGAAGALLGAAIGIVSGENVLESAGKGAALGGAIGATAGGANAAASEPGARAVISEDLRGKSLDNKAVLPHTIAHGFIFFPGEAKGAQELRLQVRVVETGELYTIRLAL